MTQQLIPEGPALGRLEDAIQRQVEHSGSNAAATVEWTAESYEGRAGAPSVCFSDVQALASELRATVHAGQPLSVSQRLALAHVELFLT